MNNKPLPIIKPLPITVIDTFMRGDSAAIGPFRTDGEYLYLNNDAIAYKDQFGDVFRIDQNPLLSRKYIDPNQGSFVGALMITLPVVGLFFWFMFVTLGAY
jgi:hypothetical protein